MITDNELRISNESYLRKDFYQIYPEILDLVTKITERWDPASSNESDPGVILLKLLAFIGDKVNYNIDKNILEAFMPSATQEESMRKLCDMMGYDMHYYRSACTDVSFMWTGDELGTESEGRSIYIPRFTNISDDSGDINYVLTEPVTLIAKGKVVSKNAIEGQLINLSINNGNIVKLFNLDDNRRLYLPESQIAENGIWIWNSTTESAESMEASNFWTKVTNLNNQPTGQKIWKFGYDSKKKLPFILFPEDIAELIGDGLCVNYTRTKGISGNILAKVLTKLASLTELEYTSGSEVSTVDISDESNAKLVIQNSSYTLSGEDNETIDDAYVGFKKTVGTFDTLVTCRDYANKIYQLVQSEINTSPIVSNIQVSDIRDDINFSQKIITFGDYGLVLLTEPTVTIVEKEYADKDDPTKVVTVNEEVADIDHFDLYLYPLNAIVNTYSATNYNQSFKPQAGLVEISDKIEDYKTISHQLKQIGLTSIDESTKNVYLIKNYYHLKAKIATTYKVSQYEGNQILNNIYVALFTNFNSRKLDYGEEIPYDVLFNTIQNADPRIKLVSLEEPELETKVMYGDGYEYSLAPQEESSFSPTDPSNKDNIYETLLAKNVLAGKLPLFDYDKRFNYSFGQTNEDDAITIYGAKKSYPTTEQQVIDNPNNYSITYLTTELEIPISRTQDGNQYTLKENELIQLIAPNLSSSLTYPAYVNYFLDLGSRRQGGSSTPCILTKIYGQTDQDLDFDRYLINGPINPETGKFYATESQMKKPAQVSDSDPTPITTESQYNTRKATLHTRNRSLWVWDNTSNEYVVADTWDSSYANNLFESYTVNSSTFGRLYNTFKQIYVVSNTNAANIPGYLVDADYHKYKKITEYSSTSQDLYVLAKSTDTLGVTPEAAYIEANSDYKLAEADHLYINYTDSDDTVHNIEYGLIGDKGYYTDNNGPKVEFSGIINPSFDLYDSLTYHTYGSGHRYSKTEGYIWNPDIVPGMFTMQGSEEINTRDFVTTKIKYSPFYCYWSTNDNNRIVFKGKESLQNPGRYNDYEYTLNNDEYFFYTNDMKNTLATLGSGTTLVLHYKNDQGSPEVKWELSLSSTNLELDMISNNGIGAFADTDWNIKQFSDDNYLLIYENQIISLGEDDTIENVIFKDISNSKIDNNWKEIDADVFKYNGKSLPKLTNIEDFNWKIRSNLMLNLSPTTTQTLQHEEVESGVEEVIQKITCYTSRWTETPVSPIYIDVTPETDLTKYYEKILLSPAVKEYSSEDASLDLRSNFTLQQVGGTLISAHRYALDGTEQDNLMFYNFNAQDVTALYDATGYDEVLTLGNEFTKISLSQISEVSLPSYIPKEDEIKQTSFGLAMFYYIKGDLDEEPQSGDVVAPTLEIESGESTISYYTQNYHLNPALNVKTDNIELKEGINIIRIDESCNIKLKRNLDTKGSVTFSNIDIIKLNDSSIDNTGINNKLLNLTSGNNSEKFIDLIVNLDKNKLFYYNAPLEQQNEIDTAVFDSYSWFNYNNVCNKFVLAQLDTDFSDIEIAKASRINKW